MGKTGKPVPVKLICGLIAEDAGVMRRAEDSLRSAFGEIDLEGPVCPFEYTDYYREEMGGGLQRRFVSFAGLIDPGLLADVKRRTNGIERELGSPAEGLLRRRVNLDPGYVTAAKLVLATTKDFSHRVYLRDGIYAEVTLQFRKSGSAHFPWTYPDLRSGEHTAFFLEVRSRYRAQLGPSGRPRAGPDPRFT